MPKRKTRVRKHIIADMSLHHLAYCVVSATYTVEQVAADYGYDVSVFTFDDAGEYENGNIYIQLKATDTLRLDSRTGEIIFRISQRDLLTWESEPFPVYLVVFDASNEKAYWLYLQRYLAQTNLSSSTMKAASVLVKLPPAEVDETAVRGWRDDKNAVLGQMGAVIHV